MPHYATAAGPTDQQKEGDMPETPAETLRRAAKLMRQRATAATPGPWHNEPGSRGTNKGLPWPARYVAPDGDRRRFETHTVADAEHVAALHPGVALLIADSWDAIAMVGSPSTGQKQALATALAYLGEAP